MGLAASRFFLPLTRELLHPKKRERAADLFSRIQVPKSPGYRILAFYEAHGALQPKPDGFAVDARQMLRLAGGLRADRAIPDRAVLKGPPLKRALALLDDLAIPHALGFQSAANHIAYFEPSGHHALYLQFPAVGSKARTGTPSMGEIAKAFAKDREASRNNRYDFFLDDLARLDCHRDVDGTLHTGGLQTLLDLATHARMGAHQEFLLDILKRKGEIA